jgi:hypothetical protein
VGDRLGAVGDLQLAEDGRDKVVDCFGVEKEALGVLGVAFPPRDQGRHHALTVGQVGEGCQGTVGRETLWAGAEIVLGSLRLRTSSVKVKPGGEVGVVSPPVCLRRWDQEASGAARGDRLSALARG